MSNTRDRLKIIASEFDSAIQTSASALRERRPELTSKAVSTLVSSLSAIDMAIMTNGEDPKAARQFFRECLGDLCRRGPLWYRGLTKPFGYPGDFVLLDAIYAKAFIAEDAVGVELDRAFLSSALAETVRRRKDMIVSTLVSEIGMWPNNTTCTILDLACGPCRDVIEVLARSSGRALLFVCVDHDDRAIKFAQRSIPAATSDAVRFEKGNVLRLRSLKGGIPNAGFGLVYSVGLLDYVPDQLALPSIRNWWRMVAPGGTMILTIKDAAKYDPIFYDWMADWTFVPRTETDIVELLHAAVGCSAGAVTTSRDNTGVSIQLRLRKTDTGANKAPEATR